MRPTPMPRRSRPRDAVCLALVLPLLAWAQDAPAALDKATQARKWLDQAGAALDRCAWEDAGRLAVWAREGLPYASDPWFDALFQETYALDRLWRPREVLGCMRLAMAALSERDLQGELGLKEEFGPSTPALLGRVLRMQSAGVRVMQSESQHEQALVYLHAIQGTLQTRTVEDGARLGARVLLDAAWSERALGRASQAESAFTELRDGFPGTRDAAIAMVMLQQGSEGAAAYRGKYSGDPRHQPRIEAVRNAVPSARRRLAARMGREEATLPRSPVGVADVFSGAGPWGALTVADHRCPSTPPVVIVFSEGLALGVEDLETVLVHELCHAVLSIELGPRYAELPIWVAESISMWAAGQWETFPDVALALRLRRAPQQFHTPAFWIGEPLRLVESPCGNATVESGLALWKRAYEPDQAMATLVARLKTDEPIDDILRELFGLFEPAELTATRDLELQLSNRQGPSVPLVARIVKAKYEGPEAWLLACEEVLAGKPTPKGSAAAVRSVPKVAEGFALWQRAKALEALARPAEALIAFDELNGRRLVHPVYAEDSRIGRVRCLQALGRKEEALAEAGALALDGFSPQVTDWARKQVENLRRPGR